MPINQEFWEINDSINKIEESILNSENELEEIIERKIDILNPNWLIIGRQVITDYNKRIDLLAIDNAGDLVIIELKKNKTTRDVVAQGLDYASWVKKLSTSDIENIYKNYQIKYLENSEILSLSTGLNNKFNMEFQEDEINKSHQIIIVASELDNHTERIVNYLSDSEIPINIVFFKVLNINGNRIISRAWLSDPADTDEKASNIKINEKNAVAWNGEYYVSFGEGKTRNWNDAMKYGFISGGGKPWYSRTLGQLNIDDRIWVNIPHTGYVGVGIVSDTVQMAKDTTFEIDGQEKNLFELDLNGNYLAEKKEDEDNAEYIVKVNWIKTFETKFATKELGFFGNQNTVCRPGNSKWIFTVDYLKRKWEVN